MKRRERFTIEREEGVTECECPDALCVHPDRLRTYPVWFVVDRGDPDRTSSVFDSEVYREALAECRRRNDEATP